MSRPRMLSSAAVLLATVAGASWYASTLFPILKAAKADVQASAPSPTAGLAGAQSGSRLALAGNVEFRDGNMSLRAARAELRLDEQGSQVAGVRAVTPENPIPRRTRGVAPVPPPQYAGAEVAISARVTLDRNGAVTSVERDSCSGLGGFTPTGALCDAFQDATAAAVRQWRYDRPAQAPIQFYVKVTFRPGTEAAIVQSSESYLREPQESPRSRAEIDREYFQIQRAIALLQADLSRLTDLSRELERAQRLAEHGLLARDQAELQAAAVRVNAQFRDLEAQIERARAGTDDGTVADRSYRAMLEQLRLTEAQLNAAAAQFERAGTGDASRQLKSPSGRAPLRVVPPVTAPVAIKTAKAQHSPEAMRARVEGTVIVEALVDEQGRVADARVVKSIPLLDQSALDAAKQWEFKPATLNGEPVPVLVQLELNFTLR